MSKLIIPALDPASVEAIPSAAAPEPFRSLIGGRVKRRLGDALGLTQFGVNLVTIGPGGKSALRHWHTHEEEFVYMIAGEVVLVTNGGEQTLTAGMCAGYPANTGDGHQLINRSDKPVTYLEVGTRIAADNAFYPDDDLMWLEKDGDFVPAHKDGTPY